MNAFLNHLRLRPNLGARSTVLLLVFASSALYQRCVAQCDTTSILIYSDTNRVVMIGDSVWPNEKFCPAYDFEFHNDSMAFIYETKEYRHNSRWVMLKNWCWGRTVNYSSRTESDTMEMTPAQLSAYSRTATVTLAPGDTLSMFKYAFWIRHDNDSIEWRWAHVSRPFSASVEVVHAGTLERLDLLDSMSFAPVRSGPPCLYMQGLIIDRHAYVHPRTSNSVEAFIRVNVFQGEHGVGHWYRTDNDEVHDSPRILHSNKVGAIAHTVRVIESMGCGSSKGALHAPTFAIRDGNDVQRHDASATLTVRLYTLTGQQMSTIDWPAGQPNMTVQAPAGVYVAIIYQGSHAVGTVRIVTR